MAFFVLVCALYAMTPVHNGNFFWHLRNGEDILDTGVIRTVDPFTWTRCGETWLQQEWGSEVLFAVSWRILGEPGPVLMKMAVVAAAVLLTALAARRRGACASAVVLTGLLWFAVSHGRWIVRPHILSILMFALYLYLLERGTGGILSSMAVFVILQVVWTNLHAGFVMGWFLLGVPVLEGFLAGRVREALGRSAVLGAAVLSAGIHPNGFGSFTYITDFLSRPLFRETIREWWSPFHPMYQPGRTLSTTAVLLTVLLGLTWLVIARRWRRIGAARILALGALSAASLLSSRNIDFLALAAAAWVSPLLGRVRTSLPAALLCIAAAVPFTAGVPREFGPPRPPGLGIDWSIYPRALAGFLRRNPSLMEARVYNTNEISGYLEYSLGENLLLYMDGRCHLYPERLYARYLILAYATPDDAGRVMSIMDEEGIELALYDWPRPGESSAYVLSASPLWLPVYWDSITVVYGRRSFLEEQVYTDSSFSTVDPLAPQVLMQLPYYLMPASLEDELVRAASPPMSFGPAMVPAAALLLSRETVPDSLPFSFENDSLGISLRAAFLGDDPLLEDPRLRLVQSWALAARGRLEEAFEAAERSEDPVLYSSFHVLLGRTPDRSGPAGAAPPMMVPVGAWSDYLDGKATPGDSAVILAASAFTAGMRGPSLDSVRALLESGMELHPWGYSVSGGIASLSGLDSMALDLGKTAVSMNRNPYTLLILGSIQERSGYLEDALGSYSDCLEISGLFLEARMSRADLLWETGRIDEALADYRLLGELDYLSPSAEFRLYWGGRFSRSGTAD
ncbi:MAG: hypothetical protein AVO35_03435 [Candidatus Aegiribacteria sp. MLS_C]|nr:MAG: hypothetical protein AVO35_03435 [Candidatus Aegiribacteria sp. MLS_C]